LPFGLPVTVVSGAVVYFSVAVLVRALTLHDVQYVAQRFRPLLHTLVRRAFPRAR
jgi:hypothetical protein